MDLLKKAGIKIYGKTEWQIIDVNKFASDAKLCAAVGLGTVYKNDYDNLCCRFTFKSSSAFVAFVLEKGSSGSIGDVIDIKKCILLEKENQHTRATANKIFICDTDETLNVMYEYYKAKMVK